MDINPELRGFIDAEGKIKSWPGKQSKQFLLLEILAEKFELGRSYTAQEINEVLNGCHTFGDPALLRRELINQKHLQRSPDGKSYWKPAATESAPKAAE